MAGLGSFWRLPLGMGAPWRGPAQHTSGAMSLVWAAQEPWQTTHTGFACACTCMPHSPRLRVADLVMTMHISLSQRNTWCWKMLCMTCAAANNRLLQLQSYTLRTTTKSYTKLARVFQLRGKFASHSTGDVSDSAIHNRYPAVYNLGSMSLSSNALTAASRQGPDMSWRTVCIDSCKRYCRQSLQTL